VGAEEAVRGRRDIHRRASDPPQGAGGQVFDKDTDGDGVCDDARYFYAQQANWNVVAVASSDGTTVEKVKYDPYGQATVTVQQGQSASGNPYLFQGRRWDDEVDLYYFRNRVMSPELGRFLQRDPIHYIELMSLYIVNFPVNGLDPFGEQKSAEWNWKRILLEAAKQAARDAVQAAKEKAKEVAKEAAKKLAEKAIEAAADFAVRTGCSSAVGVLGSFFEDLRKEIGGAKSNESVWYGHCYVACVMTEVCGSQWATRSLGFLNEVFDEAFRIEGARFSWDDIKANEKGIKFAEEGKDCHEGCAEKYPGYRD